MIKVNDPIWHPCNMDIIEHKVISIRQFDGFNHYVLKAKHDVGACGKLEVIIDEHKGNLRFVELLDEENIEYSSGLQDFVEGNYYTDLNKAKLSFYTQQETLAWSNMEQKKRWYEDAVKRHNQVKLLVKELKELIKNV
jgi:predicted nucleotide-binding protein (sugar kinase/HSP70/actin superfamily)